jgi:hypothetical protein
MIITLITRNTTAAGAFIPANIAEQNLRRTLQILIILLHEHSKLIETKLFISLMSARNVKSKTGYSGLPLDNNTESLRKADKDINIMLNAQCQESTKFSRILLMELIS